MIFTNLFFNNLIKISEDKFISYEIVYRFIREVQPKPLLMGLSKISEVANHESMPDGYRKTAIQYFEFESIDTKTGSILPPFTAIYFDTLLIIVSCLHKMKKKLELKYTKVKL